MIKKNFDVVVIGGGIIGLSTAYYLLKKGKKVLVVEKNEFGSGASGACDEMILLQSKKPGILLEIALESLELYKLLSKELGMNIEFRNPGAMVLIENEQEIKVMEDFVKVQRSYGLDVEMLDRKEVLKKQPHANKNIIGSTYCPLDSQVNPLLVLKGFMLKGSELGLEEKKGIKVKEIKEKKDYWEIIFENGEFVETEYIVNAAGVWAKDLGKMVGVNIPIIPKRGQLIVTEPTPKIGETNVLSAKYIARRLKPEAFSVEDERIEKLGIGFTLTYTGSGNYLIGSTSEYEGYNNKTTYEALKILANQSIYYFPILENVHIISSFAGLRPITPDGIPIMGEIENKKGYFIASGLGGDGIALAPIIGKLMAQIINGEKVQYPIEQLNNNRFEETWEESLENEVICRCEEVKRQEIEEAIKMGASTINEIKKYTRAGMGLCQGKTCRKLVEKILVKEIQKDPRDLYPSTYRQPVRPVKMKNLKDDKND